MREVRMVDYANNLSSQTGWLRRYYRRIELWQTLCHNESKTRPRIQNCFGFLCVVLVSGKCFWILGCVLNSGMCFGFWHVFWGFWHLFCPYEPPYCCEAFFVFLLRELRPFFEDVLCCMAWLLVFPTLAPGVSSIHARWSRKHRLSTTYSFHRSKERYTVETVNKKKKKKLSVFSL